MSIKIEIIDPHLTPKQEIYKLAKYLMGTVGLPMSTDMALLTVGAQTHSITPAPSQNTPTAEPGLAETYKVKDQAEYDSIIKNIRKANPLGESANDKIDQPCEPTGQIFNPHKGQWETPAPADTQVNTFGEPLSIPSVELDSACMPWDTRIHAKSKSKTSDGKWRYRRNIDAASINAIESDIRQARSAPAVPVPPAPPPCATVAAIPAPPPPQSMLEISYPKTGASGVPPRIDIAPPKNEFPVLMTKITAGIQSGKLNPLLIAKTVQEFGIPNLPTLATRPDLVPAVMVRIDEIINGGA